jgi:hypothetical protein
VHGPGGLVCPVDRPKEWDDRAYTLLGLPGSQACPGYSPFRIDEGITMTAKEHTEWAKKHPEWAKKYTERAKDPTAADQKR